MVETLTFFLPNLTPVHPVVTLRSQLPVFYETKTIGLGEEELLVCLIQREISSFAMGSLLKSMLGGGGSGSQSGRWKVLGLLL